MKAPFISALAASAAIVFAPYASADVLPLSPPGFNSDEQAYLRELHYNNQVPIADDKMAVDVGRQVCQALSDGYTEHALKVLWGTPQKITDDTANMYIDSAVTYLCPKEEQWRPELGIPPDRQHGRGASG